MPSEYADQPQTPDFTESVRRTKSQYSVDAPRFTPPPTPYVWQQPERPSSTARSSSWAGPGGGVSSGEGGGGEPSRPVHVTQTRHEHYYDGFPEGRDYNDEPAPPITGSDGRAGGSPIVQTPSGPKPSMNGASELPEPVVDEMARAVSRGVRIPV
jgi:hypothetical protein